MKGKNQEESNDYIEPKRDDNIPEEIHQRAERILEALLRTPPISNSELIKKNSSEKS